MRLFKWKCLIFLSIFIFVIVSAAGFSEAAKKKSRTSRKSTTAQKTSAQQKKSPVVTSDDIIAEEMLRLAEALRKTSQLERGIPSSEAERDRFFEQYDAQIAELERQIAEIEEKKDALLEAGVSDDEKIEQELWRAQNNADDIADRLYMSFDIMPEYIFAFHPKASSQIVDWTLSKDANTDVETLQLTILHNRKTQRLTRINVLSELTESGDIFFTMEDLPEGLQIIIPGEGAEHWTVTADGRVGDRKIGSKGYFVAEIVDPDDIPYSELDGDSNINDDGSKTFESGEAFIILRKSSITIRPTQQHH